MSNDPKQQQGGAFQKNEDVAQLKHHANSQLQHQIHDMADKHQYYDKHQEKLNPMDKEPQHMHPKDKAKEMGSKQHHFTNNDYAKN